MLHHEGKWRKRLVAGVCCITQYGFEAGEMLYHSGMQKEEGSERGLMQHIMVLR